MSRILGIDLGTTNTCAAYVSHKIPRVVPTEGGYNTMPSVVTMHPDGSVLVGQRAKELQHVLPDCTLHDIKRLLGRQYGSRTVQDLVRRFGYKIVPGDKGRAAVEVRGTAYSAVEVQSKILAQIKRYAEINLGEELDTAVIAVPAYYTDQQRSLVKEAGKLAGWTVRRIVNEPTAAALAYGFNRGFDQKILIYDLGGGTFDVSILELTGNVFQVVATGGDTFLGGADFDDRIAAWIVEQIKKKYKLDVSESPEALQHVWNAAERAKIELSLLANTQIRLPELKDHRGRSADVELVLDRDTLNTMSRALVQRTLTVIDRLMGESGLTKADVDEIILVGGQTRMPLVVDAITEHLGKSPRKGVHPDECVALGAALLGDSLTKIDAVTLLDALSVPIGIAKPDGSLQSVLDKHTQIPHTAHVDVQTHTEQQTTFEIEVFQGEAATAADAEYLGTLFYEGVPPAPAGQVSLGLDFHLDEEGMLLITAQDNQGGQRRTLRLATVERPVAQEPAIQESAPPSQIREETSSNSGFKGFMKSLLKGKNSA